MRVAHLCCGLGGSLWTGAILGWKSIYAMDSDPWRIGRLQEQARAGWWPDLRAEVGNLPDGLPPALDGGVDCLAAGFSCRDISAAGKGAGLGGTSTGPTYAGCLRAIDLWRPRWVFFENSPRIRTKGRHQVTADLVARGYRWRDGIIGAVDIGAPHIRERWFLLAHLGDPGLLRRERIGLGPEEMGGQAGQDDRAPWSEGEDGNAPAGINSDPADFDGIDGDVGRLHASSVELQDSPPLFAGGEAAADPLRNRFQISLQRSGIPGPSREAIEAAAGYCGAHHWNPPLPDVCRVVDGLAAGLDRGRRIEALGDAWVPLQAATAWKILGGP